jgi:hypothetical protein
MSPYQCHRSKTKLYKWQGGGGGWRRLHYITCSSEKVLLSVLYKYISKCSVSGALSPVQKISNNKEYRGVGAAFKSLRLRNTCFKLWKCCSPLLKKPDGSLLSLIYTVYLCLLDTGSFRKFTLTKWWKVIKNYCILCSRLSPLPAPLFTAYVLYFDTVLFYEYRYTVLFIHINIGKNLN